MSDRRTFSRRGFMGGVAAALGYLTLEPSSRAWAQGIAGTVRYPEPTPDEYDALAKLANNENPYGPSAKAHEAMKNAHGVCNRYPDEANDVLIDSEKVCGILTEISADSDQLRFAVIGIGVNVNQRSFPAEFSDSATSLLIETGKEWSRTELLIALLQALELEYRRTLSRSEEEALLHRLEAISSYVMGRPVHVDEAGGYDGITAGLDRRGFLRVRTPDGMRTVLSGGVRERS